VEISVQGPNPACIRQLETYPDNLKAVADNLKPVASHPHPTQVFHNPSIIFTTSFSPRPKSHFTLRLPSGFRATQNYPKIKQMAAPSRQHEPAADNLKPVADNLKSDVDNLKPKVHPTQPASDSLKPTPTT
jgi:hypothetical protein